jgi:hypothetical protein
MNFTITMISMVIIACAIIQYIKYKQRNLYWTIRLFKTNLMNKIQFWKGEEITTYNIFKLTHINQIARILLSIYQLLKHKQISIVERVTRLLLDLNIDSMVVNKIMSTSSAQAGSQPECRDDHVQVVPQAGALSYVLPTIFVSTLGYIVTGKQVSSTAVGKLTTQGMKLFVNLGKVGNAALGVEKLFERLANYTDRVLDFFFGIQSADYKAFLELDKLCYGIMDWSIQVEALSLEPNIKLSITNDKDLRNKVIKLKKEAQNFMNTLGRNILAKPYMDVFQRSIRTIQELGMHAEICQRNSQRYVDPFVLSLFGQPGIGKSYLLNDLVARLAKDINLDSTVPLSFARNAADKFWSGYCGQFATIYDDFAQFHDANDNTILKEFIDVVSPKETQVNMADLDNKGLRFSSSLIILTDNVGWPTMTTMRDNEAFLRRRNLLVEMKHKDNRKFNTSLDLGKTANEHLLFRFRNPLVAESDGNAEWITYTKFYQKFKQVFIPHYNRMKNEKFELLPLEDEIEVQAGDEIWRERRDATWAEIWTWAHIKAEYKALREPPTFEQQLDFLYKMKAPEEFIEKIIHLHDTFEMPPIIQKLQDTRDSIRDKMQKMREIVVAPKTKTAFKIVAALLGSAATIFLIYKFLLKKDEEDEESIWQSANESGDHKTRWAPKRTMVTRPLRPQNVQRFYKRGEKQMTIVEEANLNQQRKMTTKLAEKLRNSELSQEQQNNILKSFKKHEQNLEKIYNAQTQSYDQNMEETMNTRIIPAICKLVSPDKIIVNAFQLYGHVFIVPYHFIDDLCDEDIIEVIFSSGEKCNIMFNFQRMKRIGDRDLALCDFGSRIRPGKDLRHHFCTESDLSLKIRRMPVELVHMQDKFVVYRHGMEADLKTTKCEDGGMLTYNGTQNTGDKNEYFMTRFWEYLFPTRKGMCGSVIIKAYAGAQRRIVGFHVAGTKDADIGWAEPITIELLQQAIEECEFLQPAVIAEAEFGFENYRVVAREEVQSTPIEPPDGYEIVGYAPKGQSIQMPTKTDIRESEIFDKVYRHVTEPSVLSPKDTRMKQQRKTLFTNGFEKYARETLPFPKNIHNEVIESLEQDCLLMKPVCAKKVRTELEAMNGVFKNEKTNERYEYMEHINWDSSPGYPFIFERPNGAHGKRYLFSEENDRYAIKNETLRKRIDLRISEAKRGKRIFSPWVDQLKDERRSLAKIEKGETRTFCMAPVDYVIVFRMYFMDFCAAFYNSHVESFHTVGIDAESPKWTKMFQKLTEVGEYGFAGDYKQFDGTAHNDAQMAFCEIVNKWYGDHEDSINARVRRVLISEGIYTLSLVGNCFYYVPQGVNSGNPATVILDSFVNQYYLRCAYRVIFDELEMYPKSNMDTYRKLVRSYSNGDDNINMVDSSIRDYYNLYNVALALKDFGIVYTSADKTKALEDVQPTEHISEMTFLKRAFLPHHNYPQFMLAPIDKKTIQELTNWIRDCQDTEQAMRENLETSLRFAYHWGPQYYGQHKNLINEALHTKGMMGITTQYESLNKLWLENFFQSDSITNSDKKYNNRFRSN